MLSYKEFYIWLDGYLSAKSKEENNGNVYYMDIFPILEKMKEVKPESEDFIKRFVERNQNTYHYQYKIQKDDDDLGKPPKIVM